jgi:hypothetical protein
MQMKGGCGQAAIEVLLAAWSAADDGNPPAGPICDR